MRQTSKNFYGTLSCCFLLLVICLINTSCKKDRFITSGDAAISTSVDSLKYDTVFTSIGSITQSFKINNLNNQKLRLSKVKLMGGNTSSFKININGYKSDEINDIEIAAEDSIYLFVTVNINPNTANLPFIVRDSIQITFNGNERFVQLEAFGQNANFLRNRKITSNTTWANNLPYVILGSLVVDTAVSLTINPGCKIYSHANAPIIIDGSLVVNGTKSEPVIFTGDRLDDDYKNYPASWPGIYFRGSSQNNAFNFTSVKNAYQALVAEQPSGNSSPKLVLRQCIIDNAYDVGIYCVSSSLVADNCLITNCGNNVKLIYGGKYSFTNCTVAAYSTFIEHKNPVLSVSNFAALNGVVFTDDLDAIFTNCIFWAESAADANEVSVSKQGSGIFKVAFDHCLYKAANDPANSVLTATIKNQDPLFDSIDVSKRYFDFHITQNIAAPGIDKGITTLLTTDLEGNSRNIGLPDLGCYEKQ